MFNENSCRTCKVKYVGDFVPLEEFSEEFPQKTLSDLLLEVARVDVNNLDTVAAELSDGLKLPNKICKVCVAKLQNAYSYVQQAQQVNEQLQEYLLASTTKNVLAEQQTEEACLEELPIDMPEHDSMNIKVEFLEERKNIGNEFHGGRTLEEERNCKTQEQQLQDLENRSHTATELHEKTKNSEQDKDDKLEIEADPITTKEMENPQVGYDDTDTTLSVRHDADETNAITDDVEEKEPKNRTALKRRRGRPTNVKETCKDAQDGYECNMCAEVFLLLTELHRHQQKQHAKELFQCRICDETFFERSKLDAHMKTHDKETAFDKKSQRTSQGNSNEWTFGAHIYDGQTLRLVKCNLCEQSFNTIRTLREHIPTHLSIRTLNTLSLESLVIKEHFAQSITDLQEVKEQICDDIESREYSKYYTIINHYGYEVSLSDSDEDIVSDPTVRFKKYYCQLCYLYCARKHEIYEHTRTQHENDILPHKCNFCKLGFVSERMYNMHLKTHCRNKSKKYQCLKCPGKFTYLQNLTNHHCAFLSNEEVAKPPLAQFYKCNICTKRYKRTTLLRAHMAREHRSASLGASQLVVSKCRNIKCCLCTSEFANLRELREHLPIHADGETGCNVNEGQYYKNFYPALTPDIKNDIATLIAQAFATEQLTKFYSALDDSANEMDLYDSESEDEERRKHTSNSNSGSSSYTCELCSIAFERRKHLHLHQNTTHANIEQNVLPHICNTCQRGFVSSALLQQHIQHTCGNVHKQIKCDKCPAQFVWTENYIKHLKVKHINDYNNMHQEMRVASKRRSSAEQNHPLAASIKCSECDKVFIWQKDLIRHKRTHLADTEKIKCPYCERRFNRKDNLHVHIRAHHERAPKKETARWSKISKWQGLDENLCKPNGCKHIQCMICQSKHTKIADLRTHLQTHKNALPLDRRSPAAIKELNELLYPNELHMSKEQLAQRILRDLEAEHFQNFYCITNEFGYEMNLSSSETDSDSEDETMMEGEQAFATDSDAFNRSNRSYRCELCNSCYRRKYLLYQHQHSTHKWQEAPHVCTQCQARFVCASLLQHHYATQCKNSEKRFTCRKCPLKFMWHENLKAHTEQHNTDKGATQRSTNTPANIYECVQCSRSFVMLKDLTRHMVMHNSNAYNLKCHWCPRKFYRKANLLMHIKRHGIPADSLPYAESLLTCYYKAHGDKLIQCKVCVAMHFTSIGMLRVHLQQECTTRGMRTHHSLDSMLNYSIRDANGFELALDDSDTEDEAVDYMNFELPAAARRQYSCEICQLTFKRKYQVALHQRSVHKYETLPLQCQKCVFKTVCMDILAYHMRTQCYSEEKSLRCSKCHFRYMWQENLNMHMRLQHPDEDEDEVAGTQSSMETQSKSKQQHLGEFNCELCSCKYKRKDRLAEHMKRFHCKPVGNTSAATISIITSTTTTPSIITVSTKADGFTDSIKCVPQPASDAKKLDKKFLCTFCGKAVTSSSNLVIHMRRHTGEKPFKCDFCEMAFPRSSDLQCHRRTHTGEKPHKCTVCEKAFARSYKLQQHMRIHSGERPYKCPYCEKSFTQKNDMTLHIRRHTGERPYICGVCGERFIQGTALKNHRMMRGHFGADGGGGSATSVPVTTTTEMPKKTAAPTNND